MKRILLIAGTIAIVVWQVLANQISSGVEPPATGRKLLDASFPSNPTITPADGWVRNLLPLVDVKLDQGRNGAGWGTWNYDEKGLQVLNGNFATCVIPVSISGDYEFDIEFSFKSRATGSAVLLLPIGNSAGSCSIHPDQLTFGRSDLDDTDARGSRRFKPIKAGERHRISGIVQANKSQSRIEISLDGDLLIEWSGDSADLQINPEWNGNLQQAKSTQARAEKQRGVLALGSSGGGCVAFHKVQIKLVSGSAQLLRSESLAQLYDAVPFVGVASCSASNCHGGFDSDHAGNGVANIIGSEYSIWIQQDKHARAYAVLYNAESARMARELKIGPAYKAQVCLNCHGPNAAPHADHDPVYYVNGNHNAEAIDGVSCEACHGPAKNWLSKHVQLDWYKKSPAEKAEFGFKDTKDLLTRARVCGECHVGAPGRDVNHDLIAAGHPRLNMEMSAFQANMKSHWPKKLEYTRHAVDSAIRKLDSNKAQLAHPGPIKSYFEVKLWAVGQIAMAEADAKLQLWRSSSKDAIWPEFAAYGCFACHHNLADPSWRQGRGYSELKRTAEEAKLQSGPNRVSYPYATWYLPMSKSVANHFGGGDLGVLTALKADMNHPAPRTAKIKVSAKASVEMLGKWANKLNSQEYTADQIESILRDLCKNGSSLTSKNWDSATQLYLAIAALHQAYRDIKRGAGAPATASDRRVIDALDEMQKQLEFPIKPVPYDSPANYGPDAANAVNQQLQKILKSLEDQQGMHHDSTT